MKKLSLKNKDILRQEVISFAKKFVGAPYKYGAKISVAPKYFDCSGFVQYVYNHFGYKIPRSTILQAEFAGKVVKRIKPGDLIFFRGISGHYNKKFPKGIGHVVLYLGGKKAIHSASRRLKTYPKIVEEGSVKIESIKSVVQKSKPLVVIKRVI
jgi:cell wall-associated NlpC family hydrolase